MHLFIKPPNRQSSWCCGPEMAAGGDEAVREVVSSTEEHRAAPWKLAFDFISSKAQKSK